MLTMLPNWKFTLNEKWCYTDATDATEFKILAENNTAAINDTELLLHIE